MCYGKVPRHLTWRREGIPVDVSTSKNRELPRPAQPTLGKLHTIEHHVQYINWGCLYTVRSQVLLRDRLGISQWVVSNCFVHHYPVSGFIPLCIFISLFIIIN